MPKLGDYSLTYRELAYVLYFNKTMAENTNFVSYYSVNSKGYDRLLKKLLASYEDEAE